MNTSDPIDLIAIENMKQQAVAELVDSFDAFGYGAGKDGSCRHGSMEVNDAADIVSRLIFMDTMLDSIPKPVYFKDAEFRYRYCNKAFMEFTGLAQDEIIGVRTFAFEKPSTTNINRKFDLLALETRTTQTYGNQIRNGVNEMRDVIITKNTVINDAGDAVGIIGIIEDVTPAVRNAVRRNKLARIKDIVYEVNNAILDKTSLDDIYEFVLGRTMQSIEGAECGSISVLNELNELTFTAYSGFDPEIMKALRIPLEDTFQWNASNGHLTETLIINGINEFTSFHDVDNDQHSSIKSTISAPIIVEGRLYGFLAIDSTRNNAFTQDDAYIVEYLRGQLANSISKYLLYENVIHMTDHDVQTGLYNRRYFENIFEMTRERCQRYGQDFTLAVFDLDGLKKVNDTYGHLAGDRMIVHFAEALGSTLRASDILARTGGDEFAALLFSGNERLLAARFEELGNRLASDSICFTDDEVVCRFSYGIAHYPTDGLTYDELVERADNRMYLYKNDARAKRSPRLK